ncbi:MAG TPA: MBL fold metallo-hydrolase [Bryobacteraceae bacterium]|nr:MBL fold metallo-hydrolase [Bryobacteraceae bacterium]
MAVGARALLHTALAAENDPTPLAATNLTETVLLITGAGANVLAVLGPDGVLLVDGGSADRSTDLLKLVSEKSGGKPVQVLFDTSWDPDCTGSNEALGKAGAKIVAHENTKLWLSTEFDSRWRKRTYEPHPKAALPTQTFYSGVQKMTFGVEPVEYGYMMQAHTDGDIYVYFPGPNILMAGGVAGGNCYPVLDFDTGGWLGPPDRTDPRYTDPVPTGIVGAQRTLLKVTNAATRIVPGKGPVMTRADLQAESEMLVTVRDRLVKLIRKGYGPTQMVEAKPTQEFDAKYGDPELFIRNAYMGLWGHVHELGGIV